MKLISSRVQLEVENGNKPDIVFNIWHNMKLKGSINTFESAISSWIMRTKEYTDESFCSYVMDKCTDMVAYTEEQYKKITAKKKNHGIPSVCR